MRKIFAGLLSLLLLIPTQTSSAAGAAGLTTRCDQSPRLVFSSPYWGSVFVAGNNILTPVPGQAVTFSVSGPATLEFPQGSQSNAQGYVEYKVVPIVGATPQDITVTAKIDGTDLVVSCRSTAQTWSAAGVRNTLDAPDTTQALTYLTVSVTTRLADGTPIPRVPIDWAVNGRSYPRGDLTDSQGKGSTTFFLDPLSQGLFTVTAKLNFGSFTSTLTKNIYVAPPAESPAAEVEIYSSEGNVNVVVKYATGSDVSVKIGSKWFRFRANSDVHLFQEPATDTSHLVTVWVDGDLENISTLSFPDYKKPTATPKPTPSVTPTSKPGASAPSRTITCKSGTKILTVAGSSPTCPSGYSLSSKPMAAGVEVVVCRKPGYVLRMARPMTTCPAGYKK